MVDAEIKSYVILDFETTHLKPEFGEIWEIAAIEMDGFSEVKRYHTLVSISKPLSPGSKRVSRVDDSILVGAPSMQQVKGELKAFVRDLPIVAHNARFESDWFNYFIGLRDGFYDSIELFALIFPQLPSHSEDNLRKFFGIKQQGAHRALQDCLDLIDILKAAHQFVLHERSEITTIYRTFLERTVWFWGWFFDQIASGKSFEAVLADQAEGNLRDFVQDDERRQARPVERSNAQRVAETFRLAANQNGSLRTRPQQIRMALEINSALERAEKISIEAPTGTGKSLAYLVPASLHARSTTMPIVISTHTKQLQNQILTKDRLRLNEMIGDESTKFAIVKGQTNYFCLRKLFDLGERVREEKGMTSFDFRWPIAYLYSLALSSSSAEVPERNRLCDRFPQLPLFIDAIRSSRDTTVGEFCPHFSYCRFFNSARKAHKSDLIIANHALAFSWPSTLPKIRTVIFDEGHHLENELSQAFSSSVSSAEIEQCFSALVKIKGARITGLLSRMLAVVEETREIKQESLNRLRNKILEFNELATKHFPDLFAYMEKTLLSQTEFEFSITVDLTVVTSQVFWTNFMTLAIQLHNVAEFFNKVAEWIKQKRTQSRALKEMNLEVQRLSRIANVFNSVTPSASQNLFKAIDFHPNKTWTIYSSPIDLKALAAEHFNHFASVAVTSATLSIPRRANYITSELGLDLTRQPVVLPSEYKLEEQAKIYFPQGLQAKPKEPQHLSELISFTENAVQIVGGRTLLILCSRERMNRAVEELRKRLEPSGIDVVYDVEQFRSNPAKCLLVGLEKFGEGLDIPGQDLACVIVEKVNESMTMKPLFQKRVEAIEAKGQSSFVYSFARRLIWLKQRVGRLVRTETDKGWIVVFDSRFEGWSPNSQKFIVEGLAPIPIKVMPLKTILDEIRASRSDVLGEEVG